MTEQKLETATFGAGCFWCGETIFRRIEGVKSVFSGYMGGQVDNPTYEQICTGTTGHAEVFQIEYDSEVVTFDDLLKIFWKMHDPTTLNRQGNDIGTQYRSAIFYHSEEQKQKAETAIQELDSAAAFTSPIVTVVTAVTTFYEAEQYHQDYYNQNKNQGYCRFVISPKLQKLGME